MPSDTKWIKVIKSVKLKEINDSHSPNNDKSPAPEENGKFIIFNVVIK